jgi:tetratricopeptide (TPR) repeat protein
MTVPTAAELIAYGKKARAQNRLEDARRLYNEAARLFLADKDSLTYAHAIRHVADMYLDESNYSAARPLYEEALQPYRSNLNTRLLDLANTVRPYALLHEMTGDMTSARPLWQEARNLYASLRIEAGMEECDRHIANLTLTS